MPLTIETMWCPLCLLGSPFKEFEHPAEPLRCPKCGGSSEQAWILGDPFIPTQEQKDARLAQLAREKREFQEFLAGAIPTNPLVGQSAVG